MRLGCYKLLTTVALPLIAWSGWKRCKKHQQQRATRPELPAIPHCFASRFGRNPTPFRTGGIWIHAVSVGETRSIFPLLRALKADYPELPLTVTNGSTQGAIQALRFAPVDIQHQMIPYDFPFAVNRFLDQIQPKLVIMIETEIWPNLYQACSNRNIPLVLANARLKEKSFAAYQKWGGKMLKDALNQTRFIGAQFATDAEHFEQLGARPDRIKTLGNLKFDLEIPTGLLKNAESWKTQHGLQTRFIWVAASTHADPEHGESEETKMLETHRELLQTQPDALLILVPRHADRFEEVADLLAKSGLNWTQRSRQQPISADTQVYLADTVGELMLWFAASHAAFIGGSLVPFGGHNILEPAALSKPVFSGPHYANLKALFDTFIEQAALGLIDSPNDLAHHLAELAQKPQRQAELGERAYRAFAQQSGALQRLMHEIAPLLSDKR
ncbi:3-deoxy-D-manno-octulosonic acid transferase [Thiomicrorhabdus sp. zzn3]|uniref:3-deoxy-D-manno-octulosonic acid transferase n=1 Tax=Thiomicrorhabdus sp. zzn3 TaxID=3039775 RepID=UPI002436B69E|nr:3-deoxy-D-manno-octulosonic acid transferase [Thiomicrorhabdus sp. zzn3]MDG6777343.1 3-deoxy-D-manno-octulosonic acid transferase [Thiomicrorhabdus sp. zzn3]